MDRINAADRGERDADSRQVERLEREIAEQYAEDQRRLAGQVERLEEQVRQLAGQYTREQTQLAGQVESLGEQVRQLAGQYAGMGEHVTILTNAYEELLKSVNKMIDVSNAVVRDMNELFR